MARILYSTKKCAYCGAHFGWHLSLADNPDINWDAWRSFITVSEICEAQSRASKACQKEGHGPTYRWEALLK